MDRNHRRQFKICTSVLHHTIQINHQLDAKIFPVYYLTFIYSSTCFGRPQAHYQELQQLQQQPLVLPLERGDSSAVGRGGAG
jgi:hypothetical protein